MGDTVAVEVAVVVRVDDLGNVGVAVYVGVNAAGLDMNTMTPLPMRKRRSWRIRGSLLL